VTLRARWVTLASRVGDIQDVPLPAAARQLVELLVSDPARRLLREVTAAGVATAVTVYVDKTAHLNVTVRDPTSSPPSTCSHGRRIARLFRGCRRRVNANAAQLPV
jgi:hypothetical protein